MEGGREGEGDCGTLMHDGDGVNDEGFQPCSELLVLCELSFDVVAADVSLSLSLHNNRGTTHGNSPKRLRLLTRPLRY